MEIFNHLETIVNGEYTGNVLYFDPTDGELKSKPKKEFTDKVDGLVLEQLAEDGFM